MLNENRLRINLFCSWLGITAIGALISISFGHALDAYVPVISEAFVSPLFIVQGGTIISAAQWLVLKKHISRAWLWIPATFIGFLFGIWIAGSGFGPLAFFKVFGFVVITMPWSCGFLVGILQWLVLRKQLSRSNWWVLMSVLGFVISYSSTGLFYVRRSFEVDWIFIWLVYGIIQAGTLIWLLRSRL